MKQPCTCHNQWILLLCFYIVGINAHSQTVNYYQTGEEFSGPFSSWKNVKTVFGAKGDGVTNDAPAINAALLALKNPALDSFNVLYFPAGTYLITDSLINPGNGYDGMAIIGEDPATTIISWGGPTTGNGAMLNLTGWYLRVSRLTFEGNNNVYRGISKTGGFSTHNEFSDLVFKDFNSGIGLDFSNSPNGQAENAVIRCHFINCSSGIASCNYNSLDQWVWDCLFEDCKLAINQCTGYFQVYNNVFIRSKVYDIGSSPYKNVIANNTSINSKCFFAGYGAYLRGNKIYSNVDSFVTGSGSSAVLLDNTFRCTQNTYPITRVGSTGMFVGNTFSTISSQWKQWPVQPPYNVFNHGLGSNFNINKQIEKAIDGNPATSFATTAQPAGIKWNCPLGTSRTAVKYSLSAPASANGDSPINFELLGSNNWGFSWDVLDFERKQSFTGGGNALTYNINNTTAYSMYQLLSVNSWLNSNSGGRSIVNTGAQTGTYCEQMILSQFPRNVYQNFPVQADTIYNVSGWMKSNAVSSSAYFIVLWYTTTYATNFAGGYPAGFIKADTIGVITGTTGWTNYTKTITGPAGAVSATFYLASTSGSSATGTAWFDSFVFSSSGAPSNNILVDADFEAGLNQQWFEVNEFKLLDAANNDLTKDADGFVSGADESWGQYYPIDNSVVDTSAIPVPASVSLPGAPQNRNRKIFEVVKGTNNDANAIQSKIDSAAMEAPGTKPVVHIPFGKYTIKNTLTIPAGSDMQIIGDGLGTGTTTSLTWGGNQTGPLLDCKGPSRVTIKDLLLSIPYNSNTGTAALVIEDADQAGGRIFGNQFNAGGPQWTQPCDVGLLADGVEKSDITMICFYPGFGNTAMVQAKGGPILSTGGKTDGQISLLAGATGDCQNLFDVIDGGRLDAEGMWNEGDYARTSGLINLGNSSGDMSIACMSWNLIQQTPYPMVSTNNFKGNLTLLMNHINQQPESYMPLEGNGSGLNVLSAYNDWGQNNTAGGATDSVWQDMTLPSANSNFIGNTSYTGALDVVVNKAHNILPDTTDILNALAQLRAVRTEPPTDRAAGVTDVKLFRVAAWGAKNKVAAHFISADTSAATSVTNVDDAAPRVTLYPTITQKYYTVTYTIPVAGNISFTVYDAMGNKISEKDVRSPGGKGQVTFNTDGLSTGIYFLRFESAGIQEVKKFLVAR